MKKELTFNWFVFLLCVSLSTVVCAQPPGITYVTGTDLVSAQAAVNAQCALGGTVVLPPQVQFSGSLVVRCPIGSNRIAVKGSPTKVQCASGGTACIIVGDSNEFAYYVPGIELEDLSLTGPGAQSINSVGIWIRAAADQAVVNNIRVDYFNTGMRLGGDPGLLWAAYISDFVVGFGDGNSGAAQQTVNTAVHLDGHVGNAKFNNFELAAKRRLILSDGPGSSGAGATFSHGSLNSTGVVGVSSVKVASSDNAVHELLLNDIEDWEVACPFLEVGNQARVVINGVGFTGDVMQSTGQHFFHMLPNSISWLRISNANLTGCGGGGDTIRVDSYNSFLTIMGSDIAGKINFAQAGEGTIVGNRCNWANGGLIGNLSRMKSSANLFCPDH